MVFINRDISYLIISTLDIAIYRKLMLVNKFIFDNYKPIYHCYLIEKEQMINNIHTSIINLFGYTKLLDSPIISLTDISNLDKYSKMKETLFSYSPFLLGYDSNSNIYIILNSSSQTDYPYSIDMIYQLEKNNSNIWKYYSYNGIIQKCNQPNKFIRKGYFLNMEGNSPYLIEYDDYFSIQKCINQ